MPLVPGTYSVHYQGRLLAMNQLEMARVQTLRCGSATPRVTWQRYLASESSGRCKLSVP